MKNLFECTKHNCEILNKHNVQYLIVGGTAVAIYGYIRHSTASDGSLLGKHDLDFWYNPTYENYFNLLKALKDIGLEQNISYENELDPKKCFFKYESEDYKMDFLPIIKGIEKFNKAYSKRKVVKLDDVDISVISYDDLIIAKEFSNREKDKIDIEMLRKNKSI